jgi:two-component system nitrate/nitrite response regulator NarL
MKVSLAREGIVAVHAATGAAALEAMRSERFDLVLMDIGLPDRSGLAVGAEIVEEHDAKVLAVTALEDHETAVRALRAGFYGYVTKDTNLKRFLAAIESVLGGEVVMPRRLGRSFGRRPDDLLPVIASQLTPRERDVLELLVEGMSGARIAEHLRISHNTVRTHVQSILAKLQVHSRLEAAAFAVEHGLVERHGAR